MLHGILIVFCTLNWGYGGQTYNIPVPGCPVRQGRCCSKLCVHILNLSLSLIGVACLGHASSEWAQGSTVAEILGNLALQFCGCTHVYGSICIRMRGLTMNTASNLSENDFNFFYHLEQISGALFLDGFPETTRIILPNLRIIRGRELNGSYAVTVRNMSVGEIIFPKLTEISRGSVLIDQPAHNALCNWAQVNWLDIIDDGIIVHSFQNCTLKRKSVRYIFNQEDKRTDQYYKICSFQAIGLGCMHGNRVPFPFDNPASVWSPLFLQS